MDDRLGRLRKDVEDLYDTHKEVLLFHGWHHIQFVAKKARGFAASIGADEDVAEMAALVHDINYIVEVNSEPSVGASLRGDLLMQAGFSKEEATRIENIIAEAHTADRSNNITKEGMALSDADTLFKALPITPILFANRYLSQNKVDISKLADKVVTEQQPLFKQGIYFYTDEAKTKYLGWAHDNLQLWSNVREALGDKDVQELIATAQERGVL